MPDKRENVDPTVSPAKKSDTGAGQGKKGYQLPPRSQGAPVVQPQRVPQPKGEATADPPPDMEIILTDEVGFDNLNNLLSEVEDEILNKTRILTEDEVKGLEDRTMSPAEEKVPKSDNPLNTQWVDELLSDIVSDDVGWEPKIAPPAAPHKETKGARELTKGQVVPPVKVMPGQAAAGPVKKVTESASPHSSDAGPADKLKKESGTGTSKVSEPLRQPLLEPLPHAAAAVPQASIAGLAAELAEIKDVVTNLHLELDEIMNNQTRILKIVLDICEKCDREESPGGLWKRLSDLKKKR